MSADPTPPTEPKPANVIQAIAAVMRDLPGIAKDDKSDQGYQFRGIEAVTRHTQHLFGRYGIVFVPRVVNRQVKDLTINNRPWTEDQAQVIYTVYGPGGVDDKIEVGPLVGLGRDNSDKGMNKAMTQAFKVALLQTLSIGDGKDDADREQAHEADARQAPPDPEAQAREQLYEHIRALPPEGREKVRAFCDERKIPRVVARMDRDQVEAVSAVVDGLYIAAAQDDGEPAPVAQERPEGPGMGEDTSEAPSEAPTTPPRVPNGNVDRVQAAIDTVAGMTGAQVLEALNERKLSTLGNASVRAQRLAQALMDETPTTA